MTESTLTENSNTPIADELEASTGSAVEGDVVDNTEGPQDEQPLDTLPANGKGKARKPRTSRANANAEKAAKGKAPAKKEAKAAAPLESDLTKAQARSLTTRVKTALNKAVDLEATLTELYQEAWNGRVWIALGYTAWGQYVDGEFGEIKAKLPVSARQRVVKQLAAPEPPNKPLSAVAIGKALGVDNKTVGNDLRALREAGELPEQPSKTTGEDGKEYDSTGGGRPKDTLVKRVDKAATKLDDAVGAVTDLLSDPDWDEKLPEFRTMLRESLGRQVTQINWLLDQMQ
jgi:hypothetical protein